MRGFGQFVLMELRLLLREPILLTFGVVLPVVLLVVFGNLKMMTDPNPDFGGIRILDIYIPPLVGMAITMLGLSSLTAVLSTYRERGILRRLATTPTRPITLVLAQMAVQLLMIVVTVALLLIVGTGLMGIPVPGSFVGFFVAFVLTASAVFAVGLFVAAIAPSAKAGGGIGTLLFFPMMFFAGLWTPGPAMPDAIRHISVFTPLGAGSQAMQAAWDGEFWQPLRLFVLLAYTVVGCVAASRLFRWS